MDNEKQTHGHHREACPSDPILRKFPVRTINPGKRDKSAMGMMKQIQEDMKTAMKNRDTETLGVIRMIRAELLKGEKEKGEELGEDKAMSLLQKMVKQRRDAAAQYQDAGLAERAESELSEIGVIEKYLPAGLSQEEIDKVIEEVLSSAGTTDPSEVGKLMGQVMGKLKQTGRPFDGKSVNQLVRQRLSG
jgi:uncharacterized protein YqeY